MNNSINSHMNGTYGNHYNYQLKNINMIASIRNDSNNIGNDSNKIANNSNNIGNDINIMGNDSNNIGNDSKTKNSNLNYYTPQNLSCPINPR